jgi:hypothetical protein
MVRSGEAGRLPTRAETARTAACENRGRSSVNEHDSGSTNELVAQDTKRFPAAIPEGPHPIPSRTRKLSPPGPMVLQGKLCGRVGRRRDYFSGMGTLRGFPYLPAMVRGRHSRPAPHATMAGRHPLSCLFFFRGNGSDPINAIFPTLEDRA